MRENFCKKKLGLSQGDDDIDATLQSVCQQMSGDNSKSRVTFYYLVAEKTGSLGKLA